MLLGVILSCLFNLEKKETYHSGVFAVAEHESDNEFEKFKMADMPETCYSGVFGSLILYNFIFKFNLISQFNSINFTF